MPPLEPRDDTVFSRFSGSGEDAVVVAGDLSPTERLGCFDHYVVAPADEFRQQAVVNASFDGE
jgi:hypothetical protein